MSDGEEIVAGTTDHAGQRAEDRAVVRNPSSGWEGSVPTPPEGEGVGTPNSNEEGEAGESSNGRKPAFAEHPVSDETSRATDQQSTVLPPPAADVQATTETPLAAPAPGGSEPGSAPRAHVRERILRRFETWLDDVLEGEGPIEGIAAEILEQLEAEPDVSESRAAEGGCDLYALWSVVTAMTEETRLQGRAFKQLHDSLSPMQELVGSVGQVLDRYMTSLEQQDQRLSESTRQAVLKDILGTLIDVRDRLVRGADTASTWLEQARTAPEPAPARRFWHKAPPAAPPIRSEHEEAVRSLLKGYDLSREVLDEALARFGVRPMACVGRPFDPGSMKAVDIDSQSDADDGTVLEIYRPGYWWHGAVYRPAEVKVARKRNGTIE